MEDTAYLQKNYLAQCESIKVGEGIIIIPDISGYTEFVSAICIEAGRYITCELLNTLIEQNNLALNVSEIEGDAILFYKFDSEPDIENIITQYESMLAAFYHKLAQIEGIVGHSLGLSLKMIVHYGSFSEIHIGKFNKLYGETVIKAHALLKNMVPSRTYLLTTDELEMAYKGDRTDLHINHWDKRSKRSGYSVYDYQ